MYLLMPLCVWHHSKEKWIHSYITKQHRTRKQYDPFYKTRVLEFAEALKSHLFNLFERNGIRRIFIQVLCFIVGSVCCSGEDVLYLNMLYKLIITETIYFWMKVLNCTKNTCSFANTNQHRLQFFMSEFLL